MSHGHHNSQDIPTVMSSHPDNGSVGSHSGFEDKLVQEYLRQSVVKGVDDHLIEFSEALRTVAKSLRRVAEGKASAQAEAAEWKRKYELEKARNLQQEQKELSSGGVHLDAKGKGPDNLYDQSLRKLETNEQSEKCCGRDGICSHEVLRDGETDLDPKSIHNRMKRKASFRLSWGCNGSGQHKHDIVSFERGNITTAVRSSKQISLRWESPPQVVLILTKPNSTSVQILCAEMVRWLKDQKKINIFVEPRVRAELLSESSSFNFVQTWEDAKEVLLLHTKVDLIVTLGGDGTVLWAASMFKGPVPPIVPFSLGSLGFMTPFRILQFCN